MGNLMEDRSKNGVLDILLNKLVIIKQQASKQSVTCTWEGRSFKLLRILGK